MCIRQALLQMDINIYFEFDIIEQQKNSCTDTAMEKTSAGIDITGYLQLLIIKVKLVGNLTHSNKENILSKIKSLCFVLTVDKP